jgi:hypothetical protein
MLEALLFLALVVAGVYIYKHYVTAAQVAAVKAEVAKLEAELVAAETAVKPIIAVVIARIKALL